MIYFDGALPESKIITRYERMEKHRQELAAFTKMHMKKTAKKGSPNTPTKRNSLLQAGMSSSRTFSKALEPPFMVASAIEHLKGSVYSGVTEIIPDEAEVGCLAYACHHHGVAMLSSDSDLVAHPTASTKRLTLVLPGALEQAELESGQSVLMADCLRPSEISHLMGISTLHVLACQRLADSAAPFHVSSATRAFLSEKDGIPDMRDTLSASNCKVLLDPRLSEVWSQYENHSRHATVRPVCLSMFLPALFEDPTRESPWVHGSDLRQLAYSILNSAVPSHGRVRTNRVLEYQRRGPRINHIEVDLMGKEDLQDLFDEDTSILKHVQVNDSAAANMSAWQKLALQAVNKRRAEDGKYTFLPAVQQNACVQAVLYSLRLLKQAAELFTSRVPTSQLVPQGLLDKLATMPALADLMDASKELRCPLIGISATDLSEVPVPHNASTNNNQIVPRHLYDWH